jgi:hypothetical protein
MSTDLDEANDGFDDVLIELKQLVLVVVWQLELGHVVVIEGLYDVYKPPPRPTTIAASSLVVVANSELSTVVLAAFERSILASSVSVDD